MELALATAHDEPELRRLLRAQAMPGWARLTCEREPDFFQAGAIQGDGQVIVAREKGAIVGMGCRSWRELYVNGRPTRVGYLSGLRSMESARNRLGLARGYRLLRHLHGDGQVSGYLTTMIEANTQAQELLTSGRAGLPRYRDLGRLITFVLPLTRNGRSAGDVEVAPADADDFDETTRFANEVGSRRQFFPVLDTGDFGTALWRDLDPGHFLVARNPDRSISGVLAGWDQSAFKQYRVASYADGVRHLRWLCNAGLRLAGWPPLPKPGAVLKLLHLALVCIRDDRCAVLQALLDAASNCWQSAGFELACVCFHERDPLVSALERTRALRYRSRLYWVDWNDDSDAVAQFDPAFIPHVEAATL